MRWLSANWIWLVVIGGMLWMHLGMHGGHGGHGGNGGHGGHGGHAASTPPEEQPASDAHGSHDGGTHRHRGC